jgi:hypothetical protein
MRMLSVVLCFLFLPASSAFAQFDTATLGGTAHFEPRVEAFNVLNHTTFRAPSGARSASAFGTITSTYDPRQLQLGFELLW